MPSLDSFCRALASAPADRLVEPNLANVEQHCCSVSGRSLNHLTYIRCHGRAPEDSVFERGSRQPRRQPEETVIGVDIGYATAVFAIPDDHTADWKGVRTVGLASQRRGGGLMLPLEGDRWMLTLGGRRGDKPSGDWAGFMAYAQKLRTPTIYDAVERAERLGEVARFGFPASVCRHFEQLEAFPRGLLPFGDAICGFNPIYGQGMSVAAQEACLLHQLLRKRAETADPLAGLASAFFTGASALIDTPWTLAAVADFAFPGTDGQRPEDFEDRLAFGKALNQLAASDRAVHKLTAEVQHLLKPRGVLRDPDLVEE